MTSEPSAQPRRRRGENLLTDEQHRARVRDWLLQCAADPRLEPAARAASEADRPGLDPDKLLGFSANDGARWMLYIDIARAVLVVADSTEGNAGQTEGVALPVPA